MSSSINLKPNKPVAYDGKHDYIVANKWFYKVEQYLSLLKLTKPMTVITDESKITYASTLLSGTAAM